MNAPFLACLEAGAVPLGRGIDCKAEAAPTMLKTRADEGSGDYQGVIVRLNDHWRVIACRDGIQWILQRRHDRKGLSRWDGNSFSTERAPLLRCIRERAGSCDPAALQCLAILPDHIRDVRP